MVSIFSSLIDQSYLGSFDSNPFTQTIILKPGTTLFQEARQKLTSRERKGEKSSSKTSNRFKSKKHQYLTSSKKLPNQEKNRKLAHANKSCDIKLVSVDLDRKKNKAEPIYIHTSSPAKTKRVSSKSKPRNGGKHTTKRSKVSHLKSYEKLKYGNLGDFL